MLPGLKHLTTKTLETTNYMHVPHVPTESWSGINQVTEPPAVMLLESDRELAPGQWQVGGADEWHVCVTTRSTHPRQLPTEQPGVSWAACFDMRFFGAGCSRGNAPENFLVQKKMTRWGPFSTTDRQATPIFCMIFLHRYPQILS